MKSMDQIGSGCVVAASAGNFAQGVVFAGAKLFIMHGGL